jgi:hypothetical protein
MATTAVYTAINRTAADRCLRRGKGKRAETERAERLAEPFPPHDPATSAAPGERGLSDEALGQGVRC